MSSNSYITNSEAANITSASSPLLCLSDLDAYCWRCNFAISELEKYLNTCATNRHQRHLWLNSNDKTLPQPTHIHRHTTRPSGNDKEFVVSGFRLLNCIAPVCCAPITHVHTYVNLTTVVGAKRIATSHISDDCEIVIRPSYRLAANWRRHQLTHIESQLPGSYYAPQPRKEGGAL